MYSPCVQGVKWYVQKPTLSSTQPDCAIKLSHCSSFQNSILKTIYIQFCNLSLGFILSYNFAIITSCRGRFSLFSIQSSLFPSVCIPFYGCLPSWEAAQSNFFRRGNSMYRIRCLWPAGVCQRTGALSAAWYRNHAAVHITIKECNTSLPSTLYSLTMIFRLLLIERR